MSKSKQYSGKNTHRSQSGPSSATPAASPSPAIKPATNPKTRPSQKDAAEELPPVPLIPIPTLTSAGQDSGISPATSTSASPLASASGPEPRIAMVSTHGYVAAVPPLGAADTGGQVVYVLELSKKLAQLGCAVDIWTRRFGSQPASDIINERVRIIRVPCGGPDFIGKETLHKHLVPEWTGNALAYIREHDLRYRFINSHYWDAGIAAQHLATALRVPHLHTPHSLGLWKKNLMEQDIPARAPDAAKQRAALERKYNFAERIRRETGIYHACDTVIATTPPQLDMLLAPTPQANGGANASDDTGYAVPPARACMIPPGYDDTRFFPVSEPTRASIRQRLGFDGHVILALGRLARNKGYDLLLDAFSVVATRVPDANLYLAIGGARLSQGEQATLAALKERAASLGIAGRVRFGDSYIPEAELPDYYRAADVFALSSRYEPFGMTAIEAMACGTPAVITTHGGLYRAITFGRHALYADAFDKEDFGITMLKVLRHPRLAARLSHMGSHRARSLFTWSGIAQQLLNIAEKRPLSTAFTPKGWDEPWSDEDID